MRLESQAGVASAWPAAHALRPPCPGQALQQEVDSLREELGRAAQRERQAARPRCHGLVLHLVLHHLLFLDHRHPLVTTTLTASVTTASSAATALDPTTLDATTLATSTITTISAASSAATALDATTLATTTLATAADDTSPRNSWRIHAGRGPVERLGR